MVPQSVSVPSMVNADGDTNAALAANFTITNSGKKMRMDVEITVNNLRGPDVRSLELIEIRLFRNGSFMFGKKRIHTTFALSNIDTAD